MIKEKKVPLRKCIVTQEQHPKMEMFRIVKNNENHIFIDDTGKAKGHGAYISKDKKIILLAQKKQILDRALEAKVPNEIYDELCKKLEVNSHE